MCRYFELVSEVGELQPLPDILFTPPKSALLNIFFEDQSWSHRFKLDLTAADVKSLVSRKFVKLPTTAFRLLLNDVGSLHGAEVMKYPKRNLRRYGAKNNDEIYVQLTTTTTTTVHN